MIIVKNVEILEVAGDRAYIDRLPKDFPLDCLENGNYTTKSVEYILEEISGRDFTVYGKTITIGWSANVEALTYPLAYIEHFKGVADRAKEGAFNSSVARNRAIAERDRYKQKLEGLAKEKYLRTGVWDNYLDGGGLE